MNSRASLLKSTRAWGLLGTAVGLYVIIFGIFGKVDMSWIMPDTSQIAHTIVDVWPKMPFFVQKEDTPQGQVIYYTVPTRQLTRQEMAQLGMTNAVPHPAKPR